MTKEENISTLNEHLEHWKRLLSEKICDQSEGEKTIDALQNAIKALDQEPCGDCISRDAALDLIADYDLSMGQVVKGIHALPSVTPMPKMERCKDCKYFEYDSVRKVNGIPLIVAHEICKRWGDGCRTKEDGYCFLFEPNEESEG